MLRQFKPRLSALNFFRLSSSGSSTSGKSPINTGVLFVPQQEAWIVERMGKFYRVLEPGLNFQIPIIDTIRYVQVLKEIAIEIPSQAAITKDNVTLTLDGVLYLKIEDPYKTSYGVEDPEFAVTQLAQTSMRSEIGKLQLDQVFEERELLNKAIVQVINEASQSAWGIRCLRYEIRDIQMPEKVKEAMQLMVEAERRKRAQITDSEGNKQAAINVAEGRRRATILASEGYQIEKINAATGEADALRTIAAARAASIEIIANALQQKSGSKAASLGVAEQYVQAFSKLAKETNTVLLPSNPGDVTDMVTKALAIYSKLSPVDGASNSNLPTNFAETTENSVSPSTISEKVSKK